MKKLIMNGKFQEFNLIKPRNKVNNKNNDFSDIEIDAKSFARLASKNISPIIIPNNNRKNQLTKNIFFDFDFNQFQQPKPQQIKFDSVIQPRVVNYRSKVASPIQNSRNQSFMMDDKSLYSFENLGKIAQHFKTFEMNNSFTQNMHPNLQQDNSKNSSTIIYYDNKFIFNPLELNNMNKEQIVKMMDLISEKKNSKYNKQTYIMKKINVFSHNYNQSIKKDIPSPKSRKSKIQKLSKNKKNKFISVINKKRKSKGCSCKNSKCLHRYCDCFQGKNYCSSHCNCINCKNTHLDKKIRNAAIEKKESKDPHSFLTKEQKQIIIGYKKNSNKRNHKSCNCKKSGCVKKYCNCYLQGMKCGRSCKCKNCENQKKKNQFINFKYLILLYLYFLQFFKIFQIKKITEKIYNLMKILYIIISLCAIYTSNRSKFWSDIQDQITSRNQLEKQLEETKIQGERNRKTINDEFIAVDSDENAHIRNFKKISEISNETRDFYIDCLNEIPNDDYTQTRIEECLGTNQFYVLNDFDYLFRTILSLYDSKIKKFMIDNCYQDAGTNSIKSNACDVLERDVLEFWWQQYNVPALIKSNKKKYVFEFSNMNKTIFTTVLEYLEKIYEEQSELLDEAYNHRDVTVEKLNETIDDKTSIIMDLAKRDSSIHPMRFKHKITLTEEVSNPEIPQKEDDEEVQEFKQEYSNGTFDDMDDEGPKVFIPSKKIKREI